MLRRTLPPRTGWQRHKHPHYVACSRVPTSHAADLGEPRPDEPPYTYACEAPHSSTIRRTPRSATMPITQDRQRPISDGQPRPTVPHATHGTGRTREHPAYAFISVGAAAHAVRLPPYGLRAATAHQGHHLADRWVRHRPHMVQGHLVPGIDHGPPIIAAIGAVAIRIMHNIHAVIAIPRN